MCFIYAFFVVQLFELSFFDLASALVCLLFLHCVSPSALTKTPPTSVIVFHRRRRVDSASRSSHHTKSLAYCSFLISTRCATTSFFFPFYSHLFVLLSCLSSGVTLALPVVPHSSLWTSLCEGSSSSLSVTLISSFHLQSRICRLIFFKNFSWIPKNIIYKITLKSQEHEMIPGLHYVVKRDYVRS